MHLISVGSKDGVKIEDRFVVFRGGEFVALVMADKVFEDKCSVIVMGTPGHPLMASNLRVGDTVESGL